METKIIPIKWNGKDEEVEIKRFTFGEKIDIQDQAITTKVVGQTMQRVISQKTLVEVSMLKGIKKAPFVVNIDSIRNLPGEIGEKIFSALDEFNTVTPEKKESLSGPSSTEQPTQN